MDRYLFVFFCSFQLVIALLVGEGGGGGVMHMCASGIDFAYIPATCQLDSGTVPTVWYILVFRYIKYHMNMHKIQRGCRYHDKANAIISHLFWSYNTIATPVYPWHLKYITYPIIRLLGQTCHMYNDEPNMNLSERVLLQYLVQLMLLHL